ncbi:Lyso-phosphatidylcholine acyltransferase [Polyrhizophydium stewartii]|uniref:Tafazzin family protein n=1 Tax=Polyrhizophydium stewartii TaxID=2732419 RepID=A0ABR4NKX3_9FUNG
MRRVGHQGVGGAINKTWIKHCSRLQVFNQHHLEAALARHGKPLISACNHSATLDDPILFGMLPWRTLLRAEDMRWSLGAKEICFTNAFTSWSRGVIPIVRGDGIHQPAMDEALALLNNDRWVHIFPEGRVNQSSEMLRFKWGIARLVMDAKTPPLVLPFFHRGMETMVPLKQHYPNPMTRVVVAFGEPLDFADPHLRGDTSAPAAEQRVHITATIQQRMEDLKVFVDSVIAQ